MLIHNELEDANDLIQMLPARDRMKYSVAGVNGTPLPPAD